MTPEWVTYDPMTKVLTIDGLRFSREVFDYLGKDAIGTVGRIVKREDGVVTIERLSIPEAT